MAVKKAPAARKSVRAKAEGAETVQTAATRRSAEAAVSALIAKFAPAHLRLIKAARGALQKRMRAAHEIVYEYREWFVISYSPNEHGYDGVLALRGDTDGVKLYLTRGKELPDPAKLLKGAANARWIDLVAASTLTRPEVVRLIDKAIALNPVPFARTGGGSVIIKSAAPKKRRSRPA